MSGFWAKVAAENGAAVPTARPVSPATGPDWMLRFTTPQQAPQAVPEPAQTHAEAVTAPAKAQSARLTETCPNCSSGNYFRPTPNAMAQCYECGHNPRFEQMAAGAGSTGGEGPAHPARQVSTANNFNPQHIVAHI